jgi:hypothetical protein
MNPPNSRRFATKIANFAVTLLPPDLKDWGAAMRHEIDAIPTPKDATIYAVGCLAVAMGQRFSFYARQIVEVGVGHPNYLIALCASLATGLGLIYMSLANAPITYLMVNASALALGFVAVGIAMKVIKQIGSNWGPVSLFLSLLVMLTSLYGISAEGATRWISIGGSTVQSSLLIIPIVALAFARHQSGLATIAIVVTALALAMQPDRGMAGALAAGMLVLAFATPTSLSKVAAAAAVCGFVGAMMQPDTLPAMPYVDQIYFSSFGVRPLAGLAVVIGAMLIIAPAIIGYLAGGSNAKTFLVFGTVWGAIGLAAALGNYPTPIVGYGSSAIIGYVLCILGFAQPSKRLQKSGRNAKSSPDRFDHNRDLRVLLPLTRSL